MEAKDLMFGDWVLIEGDSTPRMIFGVNAIMTDIVIIPFPEDCCYRKIECSKLNPIPLTKEILEENGFKCDAHPNYICDSYFIDGMNLLDFRAGYFKYSNITIEYVHQLQQLLRLCNIKKEIEL